MKKIVWLINSMDLEELRDLQKDIENNSEIIKKALWSRMQDLSNSDKFCATCFRELKNPKYTLIVGDKFKRRLSFCEIDCFHHYLRNVEELREELMH